VTQAAEARPVHCFSEHRLRLQSRNKGLGADHVRDRAGGEADRPVGPEVDGRARQRGDEDGEPDGDPLSQVHVLPNGTNTGL